MSPEDREAIFAQIGVKDPGVQVEVVTVPVADVSPEEVVTPVTPERKRKKATKKEVVATTGDSASDTLARILKNAGASKEAALSMCDVEAQAFFDASKIDKIEAARRGLADRSVHNKPLWEQAQTLRNTLKTGVRKHYASASIATKIKATSKKAESTRDEVSDADLEAFVASAAFQAAFAQHKKSLNAQEG